MDISELLGFAEAANGWTPQTSRRVCAEAMDVHAGGEEIDVWAELARRILEDHLPEDEVPAAGQRALDEMVYETFGHEAAARANAGTDDEAEGVIAEGEHDASTINNLGPEYQIAYLVRFGMKPATAFGAALDW